MVLPVEDVLITMVTLPHPLFNLIVAEVVRWNDVICNISIHPNQLQAK
jgi:hypothetical protein